MKKLSLLLLCVPLMFSCGEENSDKDQVYESKICIIKPGEKGILLNALEGLDAETIYGEGEYTIGLLDTMIIYDVKSVKNSEVIKILTKNALSVSINLSITHRPIYDRIGYLELNHGKEYFDHIINPTVRSVTKKVISNFSWEELYSIKREQIIKEIYEKTKFILSKEDINVIAIDINDVILPTGLEKAITERMETEQLMLEYQYKKRDIKDKIISKSIIENHLHPKNNNSEGLVEINGMEGDDGLFGVENRPCHAESECDLGMGKGSVNVLAVIDDAGNVIDIDEESFFTTIKELYFNPKKQEILFNCIKDTYKCSPASENDKSNKIIQVIINYR